MTVISKEIFRNIRRIQITTNRMVDTLLAGAYHSAFKGHGMQFEDVREYQPGDEVRNIDWNVTARMNHPFTKNFQEERELTVMLVVDLSASSRFGSQERLKSELIAEISAVLAFSAIKNNDNVGLILFSSEVEHYIPPKRGVRHVLRVIRELLVFKAKHKGTDIGKALLFLSKVQKKQGVCFLISDFIASNYTQEITLAAKRHDLITIGISDPLEQQFPHLGLLTMRDLETGKMRIVDSSSQSLRQTFLKQSKERIKAHQDLMNQIGASFLQLSTDKPYAPSIRNFLKRRERKR